MTKKPTITMKQIAALKAAGRIVYVYPMKRIARVDGWKQYRIIG